jgi:carboxylesterase
VLGPALEGHATHLSHILSTDWRDWYNSVDRAYLDLRAHCSQLFAIGLSLGGSLALHLSAHRRVDGVISASTPAYIKHPYEFWFRTFPFLFSVIPSISKEGGDDDTQDPTVKANHVAYDRNPTRQAASMMFGLFPHVRIHLEEIRSPALFLQGRQDRTIPADSMPILHAALGSADRRMIWLEPSGHLVFEDYAKQEAFERAGDFISSHIQPK